MRGSKNQYWSRWHEKPFLPDLGFNKAEKCLDKADLKLLSAEEEDLCSIYY